MKTTYTWTQSIAPLAAALAGFALTACDVEKTEDGEMPEVNVEGGKLPSYDVDAAEVDVKTKKVEVEVPTIEVEEADAGEPDPE